MKFIVTFDFKQRPATPGMAVRVGDNHYYTLDGKAEEYRCEPNELLVITAITHSVDKLGMLKDICLMIDGKTRGGVGDAVTPGKNLSVMLVLKRAEDFRLPPAQIDYPITVTIEATQYQVTNISP